jgi:molecular chaperone DnaK
MASIGIDLGTTNSVGAYFDGKEPRILSSTRADGLVPSVVAYRNPRPPHETEGTILTGQPALNYSYKDPVNAIFSIKRLMGRHYDDPKVTEVADRLNYSIVRSSDSDSPGVRVKLGGKELTPVEISACILRLIKESGVRTIGEEITHAVITVPAYFGEPQRAATRAAGEQAGLIIKKIIDEPSAAAIAYGFTISQGQRRRLLVYDLGGGTFDVSIIMTVMDPKGKNHFEVLDYRGDNWLGGDDFDREIVDDMVAWIKETYDFDPSTDKAFQLVAKQAAEQAKIALSQSEKTDITLPVLYKMLDGRIVDLDMSITRARFEEKIRPYVETTLDHVKKALTSQGLHPEDITNVLMVGGSTLVPLVYQSVADLFGKERVQQMMNAYHAVALGAGILANTLHGIECPNFKCRHVNDESLPNCSACGEPLATAVPVGETISITERTPESIGIRAIRGSQPDAFEVIVPKGEIYPMPRPKTKIFYTTANNFIRVPVFRGDDPTASRNQFEGMIELNEDDFRKEAADVPMNTQVEVSVNFDRNRCYYLRVRVQGTNIERELKFRRDVAAPPLVEKEAEEDWSERLRQLVDVAEFVFGKYGAFMESREQKRLSGDIEQAMNAIASGNSRVCRDAYQRLAIAIDSCGIASLLFQAEQLYGSASADRAKKISEVIDEIKDNWHKGNRQAVEELKSPLRAAIAAENRLMQGRQPIPDQKKARGLVRVGEK